MRARATLFATIAVVAVAGCKDSGLPDRNLPIEEAAHRPPDALVQAVHPEVRQSGEPVGTPAEHPVHGMPVGAEGVVDRAIAIGEQSFVPAGTPVDIDPASLSQVGSSGAMTFHAAIGDEAPYDRVWMTHPGGSYIAYMPLHAQGDAAARWTAKEHTLTSGGAAGGH